MIVMYVKNRTVCGFDKNRSSFKKGTIKAIFKADMFVFTALTIEGQQ